MAFGRKLVRRQGQAFGELTRATRQLQDLGASLKNWPDLVEKLDQTGKILDAVLGDIDQLACEQQYLRFLIGRILTPEQEARYRAEWQASQDEAACQPES